MQIFLADIGNCYDKEGCKPSAENTHTHTQKQFYWSRNPRSMLHLSSGYYQSYAGARNSVPETGQDFESFHIRSEQNVYFQNLPYKCF